MLKSSVKELLKKYRKEIMKKSFDFFDKQMRDLGLLLVFLFLDVGLEKVKKEYIPKLKEPFAKEQAEIAFEIAKDIANS